MTSPPDTTRTRLLEATGEVLQRSGREKLTLVAVASAAGVSRPTLYSHFPSKEHLLDALAEHEQARFDDGLATAVEGRTGADRLDAVLRFVVDFQALARVRALVAIEPGFVVEQLGNALPVIRAGLLPHLEALADSRSHPADPEDVADAVARVALSHFLFPADDEQQFLRELRTAAGIA